MRLLSLAALLVTLAACDSGTSPPTRQATPQPGATNSGAIAVVAVGDQLKAYIPGEAGPDGHALLWVVDAASTSSGGSAYLGIVDLGTDGDAEVMAAIPGLLVAASLNTPYLWFIDPATDTVTRQLKLPDGYGAYIASDRNIFMGGVAIDAAHRVAYVSVWSGFIVVDLDAMEFVDDIFVAPSENFAFDAKQNRLVAPFYACPTPDTGTTTPPPCDSYRSPDGTIITQGLNIVDLDTREVFTYVDPGAADQSAPLGISPDGVAADPTGNLALVAAESPPLVQVLQLADAVFTPPAPGSGLSGTFTVPRLELATAALVTELAVEPGTRLGVGFQEHGGEMAFFDLAALTASGDAITGTMPPVPWGVGPWDGHSDPHGALAGLVDGKPVAWVPNNQRTWLARVDLELLQQAAQSSAVIDYDTMVQAVTYVFVSPAP